ncbi:MAG: YkgJ family cysteine cluster protein [Nanoarchaeota archaeon]
MIDKDTPLKDIAKLGKPCKKCGHCCQYGSGALIEEDVKNIARYLNITEKELKEKYLETLEKFNTKRFRPKLIRKDKPFGKCVFYDNGCKIHEVKPLQCKINNCGKEGEELSIWFTLNYFINKNDPESIRQFNDYLRSGGKTLAKGELKDYIKDEKKLKDILSFKILK